MVVAAKPIDETGVINPVASSVVNFPAAGAVPPIAGGDANSAVTPAPESDVFTTSVVNVPAAGVPLPMAVGDAKVVVTLVAVW